MTRVLLLVFFAIITIVTATEEIETAKPSTSTSSSWCHNLLAQARCPTKSFLKGFTSNAALGFGAHSYSGKLTNTLCNKTQTNEETLELTCKASKTFVNSFNCFTGWYSLGSVVGACVAFWVLSRVKYAQAEHGSSTWQVFIAVAITAALPLPIVDVAPLVAVLVLKASPLTFLGGYIVGKAIVGLRLQAYLLYGIFASQQSYPAVQSVSNFICEYVAIKKSDSPVEESGLYSIVGLFAVVCAVGLFYVEKKKIDEEGE
eukprot:PhF_6_TR37735/c0_g1_i1/m.56182